MKRGIVRFMSSLGITLALVLVAPHGASANCATPECTPNDDGTGCCKKSTCTWQTAGSACRDEEDACHKGTCQANLCVQPGGGGANASNGSKCFVPENPCLEGECHGGDCSGINNASGEFAQRCPDVDANPCTDHCNAVGTTFIGCDTHNAPNGVSCYATSGTSCRKGACVTGACDTTGSTPASCASLPECSKYVCDPGQGCVIRPDTTDTCDNTSATDCKEKVCVDPGNDGVGNGSCKTRNLDAGEPCAPGDGNACTIDECNPSGSCNVNIPVPDNPVTDCTNTNPPPSSCQVDQCYQGTCQNLANGTQNGLPCQTDSSNCTNQICAPSGTGACIYDTCNIGPACATCGVNGSCGFSGTVCTCVTS